MTEVVEFDVEKINTLRAEIQEEFNAFLVNSEKATNKSGARRARKNTSTLTKLMKTYRATSIK